MYLKMGRNGHMIRDCYWMVLLYMLYAKLYFHICNRIRQFISCSNAKGLFAFLIASQHVLQQNTHMFKDIIVLLR